MGAAFVSTVAVVCMRRMMYAGAPVAVGDVLNLEPVQAFECVASGRAAYVDKAAAEPVVRAAVQTASAKLIRSNTAPADPYRIGRFGRAA